MSPDDPRHGTTAGHAAGCRDACCREARNASERRRRKHRQVFGIHRCIDGTGTRRRIQALWALGWTSQHIADACGWSTPQAVTELVGARRDVYIATAAAVARTYDQLSMALGPSAKNRRDAQRKGWAPPLAWDDIDNDPAPRGVGSTPPNRADTIRDLHGMKAGVSEVCRRLHINREALQAYCKRHGLEEVYHALIEREEMFPNQYGGGDGRAA